LLLTPVGLVAYHGPMICSASGYWLFFLLLFWLLL